MKNKILISILSVLLILLFSPIVFSQDTVMRIEPSSLTPSDVGDIFSVDIVIEHGQNVTGCQVWLTYNPTVLKYADFEKGRFFPDDAFYGKMQFGELHSTKTRLRFPIVTFPPSQHSGDGTIITLYFEVLDVTTSYLLNLVEGDLSSGTGTLLSDVDRNLLLPHVDDHGNTKAKATRLSLGVDGARLGAIKPNSDVDYFEVKISGPGELRLYTFLGRDVVIELQDSTGSVPANDDIEYGPIEDLRLRHNVNAGIYYIKVTGTTENSTENYRLRANFTPESDDHGNTWADATPLPRDGSLPGVIEMGNDADYFRVEVPSRGELTLYTTGNLDTFGQLERATGDKTRNNNSGSGLNFRIHHDVIPQIYYVRVTASSNMTGSYTIHASFTPKVEELPDLTGDGSIDENDFLIVVAQFGLNSAPATTGDTIEDITDATVKDIYKDYEASGVISEVSIAVKTHADLNTDGTVDFADIELIAKELEDAGVFAAPNIARLTPDTVKQWMMETKQVWESDPAFFDGIAALEQFHTLLPPMATALLSNYPNPFNPETWIPYHLAKPADVRLTIYDINGRTVRTLDVGYQPAGHYQDRTRAAYWDGRNTYGEPVASGVYFYMLSAGDFTTTRRMLIRK